MPGDRVRVIPTPRSSSVPSALVNAGAGPVPLGGVVLRAGGAASLGAFTTLAQGDRNLRDRAIPPARRGRHLVAGIGDDAEVAGAVQAERRDEDVVGGGIVARVEPAREP